MTKLAIDLQGSAQKHHMIREARRPEVRNAMKAEINKAKGVAELQACLSELVDLVGVLAEVSDVNRIS